MAVNDGYVPLLIRPGQEREIAELLRWVKGQKQSGAVGQPARPAAGGSRGLANRAWVRFAKITEVRKADGTAWTDFATDGWPSHCEADWFSGPDSGSGTADTGETSGGPKLLLKLNEDPAATVGFRFETGALAVGRVVGYLPAVHDEPAPGEGEQAPGIPYRFDGYVVHGVGGDGDMDGDGGVSLDGGLPLGFAQYQVAQLDADLIWHADWVRAHP